MTTFKTYFSFTKHNMYSIPKTHPRYKSLRIREKISKSYLQGLVHETGLIAHGRGEAYDYLIGEKTSTIADNAEKTAAAVLLCAKNPVISVNGNVAALTPEECVKLSNIIPAKIEVNLFHRTKERIDLIINELQKYHLKKVYGQKGDALIPGLDHNRAICDQEGLYSADVVLVLLEDGDRCTALKKMDKTVIAVDLNPLSRTAKTADITIIDNITRAIPKITEWVKIQKKFSNPEIKKIITQWDNKKMLSETLSQISKKLNSM